MFTGLYISHRQLFDFYQSSSPRQTQGNFTWPGQSRELELDEDPFLRFCCPSQDPLVLYLSQSPTLRPMRRQKFGSFRPKKPKSCSPGSQDGSLASCRETCRLILPLAFCGWRGVLLTLRPDQNKFRIPKPVSVLEVDVCLFPLFSSSVDAVSPNHKRVDLP